MKKQKNVHRGDAASYRKRWKMSFSTTLRRNTSTTTHKRAASALHHNFQAGRFCTTTLKQAASAPQLPSGLFLLTTQSVGCYCGLLETRHTWYNALVRYSFPWRSFEVGKTSRVTEENPQSIEKVYFRKAIVIILSIICNHKCRLLVRFDLLKNLAEN